MEVKKSEVRVLHTYWFSNSTGVAGVVVAEVEETKEVRAFIGVGVGNSERLDAARILSWGSPVSQKWLVEMLNHLTPPDKDKQKGGNRGSKTDAV